MRKNKKRLKMVTQYIQQQGQIIKIKKKKINNNYKIQIITINKMMEMKLVFYRIQKYYKIYLGHQIKYKWHNIIKERNYFNKEPKVYKFLMNDNIQQTIGYTNIQKDKFCESIQQNQDTIDILLEGMNTNIDQMKKQQYVESFDFIKTKYKVGQWIDVKDTVNQWLEAQIIKISGQEQKLFVHYNGWATRWDEWIDAKSDRIALFRTHTVQSQASLTMSPYPINEIDGDRSEMPERRKMDDILFQTCGLLNQVNSKLIQLTKVSNKVKFSHDKQESEEQQKYKQVLSTQLAPIFDRTGRMIMDLAMLLGEIGSESQRIDNDEDEEEKSQQSDQNEQQLANNIDIQSIRSNSSLGRYSIQQNDGNQHYEGSQSSHNNNRNRQRHNYKFQVPVMLNPGELHKVNSINTERFQISRIVQIPQNINLQQQ
ncbi:hypothetical protein IMG5_181380 [Ichthyophthirius multifiliis]|uniref:Tudor-knot domain-containing protein n=1 Tax=Ichthyophthirius multifiliis TaxID=5932 RepID=G0R2T7_ICHMU|nr:hypothetical protein IMG5_181380 [Ichthyophthirius multifiliis]EGR28209.1 hypothetical protein IMG5_181380 [Ichthyophthirius multifiliis]|eukprot:XP_004027554.1 hypothetical protein IMG5_181380 [Ichthyophthirius multifiliis]